MVSLDYTKQVQNYRSHLPVPTISLFQNFAIHERYDVMSRIISLSFSLSPSLYPSHSLSLPLFISLGCIVECTERESCQPSKIRSRKRPSRAPFSSMGQSIVEQRMSRMIVVKLIWNHEKYVYGVLTKD